MQATTTSATAAVWSRQHPIVLDSSSSPPRVALSPHRFKTARSWDLPLHSSSPPPVLCLPKKQPALKAGSRAEPLPSDRPTGFRSARDLAAELGHGIPDDPKESKHKESTTAETNNNTNTARKGSKKRKSDELESHLKTHDNDVGQKEGRLRRIKKPEPQSTRTATTVTLNGSSPGMSSRYFAKPTISKAPARETRDQGHRDLEQAGPDASKQRTQKLREKDMPVASNIRQTSESGTSTTGSPLNDQIGNSNTPARPGGISSAPLADGIHLSVLEDLNPRASPGPDLSHSTSAHEEKAEQTPPLTAKQDIAQEEQTDVPNIDAQIVTKPPKSKRSKASLVKKPEKLPKPSKPPKAPAKSSRTVTGIVLAQFDTSADTPEPAAPAYTARQLLGLESLTAEGTPQKKKKRTTTKSRNKAPTTVRLLSPEDVQRRVRAQDTMFGTSSQLATEDSPRTIRMLQQAYRESEAAIIDLVTPQHDRTCQPSKMSSAAGDSRGLWSVGTRGDDDYIFSPEPFPPHSAAFQQDDSFEDVDTASALHATEATDSASQAQTQEPSFQLRLSKSARSSAPKMRLADASSFVMPLPPTTVPSAPLSTTSVSRSSPSRPPLQALEPQSVQAQTSEAKPRGRSRKNAAPQTDSAPKKPRGRPRKDADGTGAATSKSKAKPKPRKPVDAQPNSDDFVAIEDVILDPDPPPTPSPPRRRASPTATLPLDLSLADSLEPGPGDTSRPSAAKKASSASKPVSNLRKAAADPDNAARMTLLFPLITAAVKAAPRGTQASPSWWEKMLLYDPIVLEDLAHWLNTAGLPPLLPQPPPSSEAQPAAPQPALLPVPAWMVQRWCEEHGVCCLWRQGMRGGVRARY